MKQCVITIEATMTERDWQKNEIYRELFGRAQALADRIFNVTGWVTNVSLALIGFHIALLLQLKFNGSEVISYLTIIPLITLALSIIVGLVLKIWYQAVEISQEFVLMKEDAIENLDLSDEEINEIKQSDEDIDKIMGLKLDQLPVFWIGAQIVLFIISIVMVSIYLIRVLFL